MTLTVTWLRGWQTIDGHKQYFDPTTGAQVKSATITIDGKQYTFRWHWRPC